MVTVKTSDELTSPVFTFFQSFVLIVMIGDAGFFLSAAILYAGIGIVANAVEASLVIGTAVNALSSRFIAKLCIGTFDIVDTAMVGVVGFAFDEIEIAAGFARVRQTNAIAGVIDKAVAFAPV